MKLTKSNIELLLKNIPEDAYIDINIADKAFKQYLSPEELERYMNTGKRYVKHTKRNWKLKVLSDIPWKYLMNISREEWSRRLLPKKNYMYNTKTGELVKAIGSSGVGYFKNTLGHETLPPIFISNDNKLIRASSYMADYIVIYHLLPYLKTTYDIDGIYSNKKSCNFGHYMYKPKLYGEENTNEQKMSEGCVPNEIILWSKDITRLC